MNIVLAIVLFLALMCTWTSIEMFLCDLRMKKDINGDPALWNKIGACACWALYFYLTH